MQFYYGQNQKWLYVLQSKHITKSIPFIIQ